MITIKRFRTIEELQMLRAKAYWCPDSVGLHSEDSSVVVDAKSLDDVLALDFSRPVQVVSENLRFHRRIKHIGETVSFLPDFMMPEIYQ